MHKYGCKTYTLNKQVRKGDKLAPYALIGHLVSYNLISTEFRFQAFTKLFKLETLYLIRPYSITLRVKTLITYLGKH